MKKLSMMILAAACCGCLHTQEVDKGDKGDKGPEPEAAKAAPTPTPEPPKATKPTSSAEARPPVEEGRPELAVSPQGLMLPEGPLLIQQALTRKGYLPADHQTGALDGQTSAALRKFQADEKVAKTGAPDRETVRRLGLSVAKVFRSSKG